MHAFMALIVSYHSALAIRTEAILDPVIETSYAA